MSDLKNRRKALGLTLRDVEEITKGRISNAYLSQLENGKITNPSVGVACELAAAYCTPVETIIAWLGVKAETIPPAICLTCGQILIPGSDRARSSGDVAQ
jgi:transcriptional regulator with XRE-family HTH domain